MMPLRLLIAGGGTGGHIFPALSIADEFKRKDPLNQVLFIGTRRGLESTVVPKRGYRLICILVRGLKGKTALETILSLLILPLSIAQSFYYVISFKPDIVLGMGGYSAGPVLLAAALLRKKTALHEQNSVAGLSNRLIGKFADKIFIHFPEAAKTFSTPSHPFGNPVDQAMINHFHTSKNDKSKFTVLIFGGSQGARQINELMKDALPYLEPLRQKIRLCHQTGKDQFEEMQEIYSNSSFEAEVFPFSNEMGRLYKEADLVIGRAGAMTIAELSVFGLPSILIPLATAADNHQEKNASHLEQFGACRVLLSRDASGTSLAALVQEYYENPTSLETMAAAAAREGKPNAAKEIVSHCYEWVETKGSVRGR